MTNQKSVKIAFEQKGILLPLDRIFPRKQLKHSVKESVRYSRIRASIKAVGIIEPLLVFPQDSRKKDYLLLDGHVRLEILKDLGEAETFCLISTDDEAFTYNHFVCVVSSIQEHFMISRAIDQGVSEDKIAEILSLNVKTIRDKQKLLQGICGEAVELLKDKPIGETALRELRNVVPIRQIEIAELMIASNNFKVSHAKCLAAASPANQIVYSKGTNPKAKFSADDLAKMERETDAIAHELRAVEDAHGRNVLNLVIVVGYLRKLLSSANVVKFLARKHPDILAQFQKLVEASSLEGFSAEAVSSPT